MKRVYSFLISMGFFLFPILVCGQDTGNDLFVRYGNFVLPHRNDNLLSVYWDFLPERRNENHNMSLQWTSIGRFPILPRGSDDLQRLSSHREVDTSRAFSGWSGFTAGYTYCSPTKLSLINIGIGPAIGTNPDWRMTLMTSLNVQLSDVTQTMLLDIQGVWPIGYRPWYQTKMATRLPGQFGMAIVAISNSYMMYGGGIEYLIDYDDMRFRFGGIVGQGFDKSIAAMISFSWSMGSAPDELTRLGRGDSRSVDPKYKPKPFPKVEGSLRSQIFCDLFPYKKEEMISITFQERIPGKGFSTIYPLGEFITRMDSTSSPGHGVKRTFASLREQRRETALLRV